MPVEVFRQHDFSDFLPCGKIPKPNYSIFQPVGSNTSKRKKKRKKKKK